ncbi:hypothetical protein, partial [Pseudomonas viridiflava]|uniref:hypothetical protein n=1 Tax=Pseudomonas viridiflava TaxID=33069 RepID=UPI00197D40DE
MIKIIAFPANYTGTYKCFMCGGLCSQNPELPNQRRVRCLKPGANQALSIERNPERETDSGAVVPARSA